MPRQGDLDEVGALGRAYSRIRRRALAPRAMAVGYCVQRRGLAERLAAVVLHADDSLGVGVHHQPDAAPGQLEGHLEALALVGHRAVLLDQALHPVVEQGVELRGARAQAADARQVALVACQRRHALQAAVLGAVVDLLQPSPQPRVEVAQIVDAALVEFAQELVPDGPVPALELALPLGPIGPAEDQMDPQPGTQTLQRAGAVGRAVVDHELDRHAPAQQRLLEHALDVQRRLAQTERTVRHQPRGVVEQAHEIGLANLTLERPLHRNTRAVHHVAVPDGAGELGAEAASLFGLASGRAGHARQVVLLQQPVQRRARQRLRAQTAVGLKQAQDLLRRAARVVSLGRQDRLLQRRLDARAAPVDPRFGNQAIKTMPAPGVVPGLNGLDAQAVALGLGNGVLALGKLSHEPLELAALQPLAADQRAQHRQAEQGQGIDCIHRLHPGGLNTDAITPPAGAVGQ